MQNITSRYERLIVALILATFVVLVAAFSLGPIFEGPDEIGHYRYIRTLKLTHALPDPYTRPGGEYHQAPLYYILMTPVALFLDDGDFPLIEERLNPHIGAAFRVPGNDNKNQFLHTRAEAFPYTGSETALAVHVLRLGSLVMGLGTVVSCYAAFRLLWPDLPALRLVALGFTAFMPQFVYLSSVISNDNLLILLASVSLLLLLRQHIYEPSRKWALLLGGVLGAALLTKLSAGFLVIPVGLSFLLDRRSWRYMPLTLFVMVLIAGWWYLRNLILFGDPTAMSLYFELIPGDVMQPEDFTPAGILSRLAYIYQTFWARFGYDTVPVSTSIYNFYGAITLFVVATLPLSLLRFIRGLREKALALTTIRCTIVTAAFGVAWIVAVLYSSTLARTLIQGRFALPGLAAFAASFALAVDVWSPERFKVAISLFVVLIMGIVARACVIDYFLPAFRVEPVPDTIEDPLYFRYQDTAELIGISPALLSAYPGETTQITLYWRTLKSTDSNLQVYIRSIDEQVVHRQSIPGTGNFPSIDWQDGEMWAETYTIFIPGDAESGSYPLLVNLIDPVTGRELVASDRNGVSSMPLVGHVKIGD
ncbi:MAG: glycosyltransferase family 39 protein [Anaerolineae bacterium]|nr:glycosyltransferase family 39 protein [Anaerolineae bacterium]